MTTSSTLYTLDSASFYKTGQYFRTNIFGSTTYAIALGGPELPNNNGPISQSGYGLTVKSGTYTSGGGSQFVVINRTATANNVTIDVSASTLFNPDGDDLVFIETGDHSSKDPGSGGEQSTTFVNFNSSKINVGNGNNLVGLGTDTSTSSTNIAKFAITGSSSSITFTGFTAAGSKGQGQAPLSMDKSTVTSGNGNDTLVTTTTNNLSITKNSFFNSGNGSDVVFFASSVNGKSILGGGNTIQLSAAGGSTGDKANDSLIINGSFDSTKFTTGSKVTVTGFDYGQDKIYFQGSVYSTSTQIATLNASNNFLVTGS